MCDDCTQCIASELCVDLFYFFPIQLSLRSSRQLAPWPRNTLIQWMVFFPSIGTPGLPKMTLRLSKPLVSTLFVYLWV